MAYEIDVIGVKENKAKKDADAIIVHWIEGSSEKVVVYDGGFTAHAEEMCHILDKYYFQGKSRGKIDAVICSHPHEDHASGLSLILDNYEVGLLYMNRPWDYCEVSKSEYPYIQQLEDTASRKGIPIKSCLQGTVIADRLIVLSPSKEFLISLINESKRKSSVLAQMAMNTLMRADNYISEHWFKDSLREIVKDNPENEMSVVLLGLIDDERFLLTGDAGIKALDQAMQFSEIRGVSIKEHVTCIQIPHHGSRHNVSPSILDRMVGEIVAEGETINKTAFASVAEKSDKPNDMVVNAFVRRGVSVYETDGGTMNHNKGMKDREGWKSMNKLKFKDKVEGWTE